MRAAAHSGAMLIAAAATPTSTEVPQPVPNDLSSGSTERALTAGPLTITIDYWSTLTMDKWLFGHPVGVMG